MTENQDIEQILFKELIKLSDDPHFSRIFDKKEPNICSLNLWILQLESEENYNRILYGMIIPSTMPSTSGDLNKWFPGHDNGWNNIKSEKSSYKFKVRKLTYYANGSTILDIVIELCKGYDLSKSCDNIGFKGPKRPFNELKLSKTIKEIETSFIIRPTIFLETKNNIEILIDPRKSLMSPLVNSPAFSASIFLLNKMSLFVNEKNFVLDKVNELSKNCSKYLKEDTGLNFDLSDSPRIGNIEFLSFPSADDYELPTIMFEAVKEDDSSDNKVKISEKHVKKVKVKIISDGTFSNAHVLLRCRLRNSEEIILDDCKEFIINEKDLVTHFEAEEEIGQILITAWKRETEKENWKIFFEQSESILRNISIHSGIMGLSGSLKSKFLEELSKSKNPKIVQRVKKAVSLNQVDYKHSEISSYGFDPWVPISQEMRIWTSKLFPKVSGGHFFQKGFHKNDIGKLSFLEWINSLTEDTKTNKIVIIDPYFDNFGVELISRAKSTNIEYVVITTLLDSDKKRIDNLKKSLTELKLILANLNFHLLTSKSKKTRLFHDRYILTYNEYDNVINGYHLSNSIQKATENYPLLITPISEDIIDDVEEYINNLFEGKESKSKLIELYPLSIKKSKSKIRFLEKINSINNVPYANRFFSIILQDHKIKYFCNPLLSLYLSKIGIINKKDSFVLNEKICNKLDGFVNYIIKNSDSEFEEFWLAFGEWLVRIPKSKEFLQKVLEIDADRELSKKFAYFLLNVSKNEYIIKNFKNEGNIKTKMISELICEENFIKSLQNSEYILGKNLMFDRPIIWSIQEATYALAYLDLELLLKTVSNVLNKLKILDKGSSQFNIQSIILKNILAGIREISYNKESLPIFLKDQLPIFRALGCQTIIESSLVKKKTELKELFKVFRNLKQTENIQILAKWTWKLRQYRNSYPEQIEMILAIYKEIVELWTSDISQEDLIIINKCLNGPGEILWSACTTNSLFIPLININKLNIDNVTIMWLNILLNKLENAKEEGSLIAFYESDEFNKSSEWFTETCAWSIAFMKKNDEYLEKFENLKEFYERIVIIKPFSRSIDSSSWLNALKCLLWIQTVFNCVRLYKDDIKFENLTCDNEELWIYANRNEFKRYLEPLLTFAIKTKEKIKMESSECS